MRGVKDTESALPARRGLVRGSFDSIAASVFVFPIDFILYNQIGFLMWKWYVNVVK